MNNIAKKLKKEQNALLQLLLALLGLSIVSACGAPFTANSFTEVSDAGESGETSFAGEASQESGGTSGSLGSEAIGGSQLATGGLSGGLAGSGGVSSSGGNPPTAGAGTAGSTQSSAQCLSGWDKRECGNPCSNAPAAYQECRQVLNCLSEKNVKPPQGSLDPCYPQDYIPLTIAVRVYEACCP